MILTWIGVSAGIVAIAGMMHYRKKWKDLQKEYYKRCEELNSALNSMEYLKILKESTQETNAYLMKCNKEYRHLMTSGCRNLKVKEYIHRRTLNIPVYSINVVGQDTMNPDLCFYVKTFIADNEEDREFAICEAEELIETINKA